MNILIFHGFSAPLSSLGKIVERLIREGHRVATPQLNSFTLHGDTHSSAEEWLSEAEQVLYNYAAITKGDFYLAGHSLGGVVCTHLLSSNTLPVHLIKRICGCAFLATPAGIDEKFMSHWRNTSSTKIMWPFSLQVQMFSFLRNIDHLHRDISVPSIVLQGGSDHHIPPSSGKILSKRLGKQCLALYTHPDADHFFPNGSSEGALQLQLNLAGFLREKGGILP